MYVEQMTTPPPSSSSPSVVDDDNNNKKRTTKSVEEIAEQLLKESNEGSNEDGFDGLVTDGERERELQVDAGTDEIRRGGIFVEVVEKDERGDSSVRDVKRGQDESRDEDCEVGRGEEEFDDGGGTSEKRERSIPILAPRRL